MDSVIETRRALRQHRSAELPENNDLNPTTTAPRSKNVVLVTCGFGSPDWAQRAQRLARQADALQIFTEVHAFSNLDQVPGLPPKLSIQLREYAQQHPKGWGLCAWRPAVMAAVMSSLPENAEVYYIDADHEISPLGRDHFHMLRRHLVKNSQLFFHLPFVEKYWTHPAVLAHFKRPQDDASEQIQASWFGLQNNERNRQLLQRWLKACLHDQGHLLQPPSQLARGPYLMVHRDAQSLLSCLIKSSTEISTLPQQDHFSKALYYRHSPILSMSVHRLGAGNGQSQLDRHAQGLSTDQPVLRQRSGAMLWPALIAEWIEMQKLVFKWAMSRTKKTR